MEVMHYLQKHILDELRSSDTARYAELMPEGIESSLFRYHLLQLVNDGDVEQRSRGEYTLTPQGESHVDGLSGRRLVGTPMPKVISYTLICSNDFKTVYLYEKPKAPYRGLYNMIGGKVHVGETIAQAAQRELVEKLAYSAEPEHVGFSQVRISSGDELISHVIAGICVVTVDGDFSHSQLTAFSGAELESRRGELAPDCMQILEDILSRGSAVLASSHAIDYAASSPA